MFKKLSKNSSVNNILIVTMSNVGDVVLAAPVMDILMRDFPKASFSVVVGERAASLFEGNDRIEHIHILEKTKPFMEQAKWAWALRDHHYDCVVDLRNSMIPYLLLAEYSTLPTMGIDKKLHLKDQHLQRLRGFYPYDSTDAPKAAIKPTAEDEALIEKWMAPIEHKPFVFIAPYAADSAKTWGAKEFAQFSKEIVERYSIPVVMIGSPAQKRSIEEITSQAGVPILNLAGQTSLVQIAAIIKRAKIAVVHDSGPMHIASYFNKPIVALFGPTDPAVSRPWSSLYTVIRNNKYCSRCQNPQLVEVLHNCMSGINQDYALKGFKEVYDQIQ